MKKLDTITSEYILMSIRPHDVNPIPVLHVENAIRYASQAIINGHRLVGVEGFHVFLNGAIQPDQELSLDIDDFGELSQCEFEEKTGALLFRSLKRDNLAFEVVFENGS